MKKDEKKRNPIVKWVFTGILVAAGIAILVFHNYIFGENSFFSQFTHANGFIKYLIHDAIPNLCQSILIIGIAVVLAYLISLLAKISFKSKKGQTLSKLFVSFLKWIIAICAIFFVVAAWGASTTITLASAGILTLIIGLGSQTLVADILAGIFIVFEGDFQVGDIVLIDNWRGEILEIGIRTTKLMDWAGNIKIVNNSEIKTIINQTKELSAATCYVSISYDARIEEVENVIADNLVAIGEKNPLILDGPYYKGVSELGQSSVVLLFVARCKEEDVYQVQRDLNRDIKILFDNNGITIPYNQLDVHLDSGESVSTRVTSKTSQKAEEFNDEQRELSKDIYVEK